MLYEIVMWNVIFWFPYYYLCKLPEIVMEKVING